MNDDATNACKLTLTGPGMQIDKSIDLQTALMVMQVIFGGSAAPLQKTGSAADAAADNEAREFSQRYRAQKLSIREYLEDVSGKTIHAKITAIGRYMRDQENAPDFSREDIKIRFRSAGEVMPGNFPRDFQRSLQAGWIAEDPQVRGRFYVTRRGDEAIDQKFEGPPPPPTRSRKKRRVNSHDSQISNGDEQ
jgi:hypothetical protein